MEENFDDIERLMKKSSSSKSDSVDISQLKTKVTAWLMRNGNIKKLILALIVIVVFGIINIINCIVNNTYYIGYISTVFLIGIILSIIIKKLRKKK